MAEIHRTVFQVEVFSDGPLLLAGSSDDPFDLSAINYAITDGNCIGNVETISAEVVPAENVEENLLRIGNDGTFFESVD